jgi:hypothetical protein
MSTQGSNKWGGPLVTTGLGPEADRSPAGAVRAAASGGAAGRPADLGTRWSRSPNVVDRRTLLGVMVLPVDGAAVVLAGLAARVWEALARPMVGDQLADRLAARPESGPEPTSAEIATALRDLQALGAVREIR